MEIKLAEFAKAGVKLVWYVDPERKEVEVFPKGNAKRKKTVGIDGTLDGGDVLPGFTLPVAKLFEKRAAGEEAEQEGEEMVCERRGVSPPVPEHRHRRAHASPLTK